MTKRWREIVLALLITFALPPAVDAQPLRLVPDVTVDLSGTTLDDEEVGEENLPGSIVPVGPAFTNLPAGAAVSAYIANLAGFPLFSFETAVELPGGVFADTGDIVEWNGAFATLLFDASAEGVPEGAVLDAMTFLSTGPPALSFDIAVDLGGVIAADEDLVEFRASSGFTLVFDGSAEGVPPALDVDAAHALPGGDWLLSFDGSGTLGGVDFDDEDVLEYDVGTGTWSLEYDGSASHPGWAGADLNAIAVPEPGWGIALASGLVALGALGRRRSSLSTRELVHSTCNEKRRTR